LQHRKEKKGYYGKEKINTQTDYYPPGNGGEEEPQGA
jgi:hypothetical protein